MKVKIKPDLSDPHINAQVRNSQRQLSLTLSAVKTEEERDLTLNLCLVLDISGSMAGQPLEIVKQAAIAIIKELHPGDHISVVVFNHKATTIVNNQLVQNISEIEQKINNLVADGGTALDQGMKLGIKEVARGRRNTVSQIFLLTDGENEHGSNQRCLKVAQLASEYSITINTLGFGENWNEDILESIADLANGSLTYIEKPETASQEFHKLLARLQSVGLTSARLTMELTPGVRLAEFKPVAQVFPETVEIPVTPKGNFLELRLGDLMTNPAKVILVNLYINQLPPGEHSIATVKIIYDDPALGQTNLQSLPVPVYIEAQMDYESEVNQQVQKSVLTLAKYRQTQIAEAKLSQGDLQGAIAMLQTAANTALQLGDDSGATILQNSATKLQTGAELSPQEHKKTRLASKKILQDL
ncbi:MAG: VWA domain-containing protein [Xenococcaceae cyanobacterium MO_167.B27]|nr:VWA domain-containing protein [Xenococcaceae cyanobacterium MO_167.B27]